MAGLLETEEIRANHYLKLQREFLYLKKKFNLDASSVIPPEFFKLRPVNFPTIRLSQFAALYRKRHFFSRVIAANSRAELIKLFEQKAHDYWTTHYVFGKRSTAIIKRTSPNFIDLLIINTIVPIKFYYSRYLGNDNSDLLLELMAELKVERNSILSNFANFEILE